jgi:phospholipid/cholesterol/gamma-HCH transport system substrate-binding protein
MESKREQAFVGLFVLIAGAVLLATVLFLGGAFGRSGTSYRAYFPFAGGLEPGASVRYAGGPKVGRVDRIQLDPANPARVEITFSVRSGLPVKTDSRVKIMALSLLGDNHLEIFPGSESAGPATAGTILPSDPYVDLSSLTAKVSELAPQVQQLLRALNDAATALKVTVDRVNDLVSDANRANLAGTLAGANAMIAENRGPVKAAVQNLNSTSQRLEQLVQDLRDNSSQVKNTLDHVDSLIGDNRADVRQAVTDLRKALASVNDLAGRLDHTLDANSENIDELLENLRHVSQNLEDFTNTIKTKPHTLIRSSSPREHVPGEEP